MKHWPQTSTGTALVQNRVTERCCLMILLFLTRLHLQLGGDLHPPHQQRLEPHPVHPDHQLLQRAGGTVALPLAEETHLEKRPQKPHLLHDLHGGPAGALLQATSLPPAGVTDLRGPSLCLKGAPGGLDKLRVDGLWLGSVVCYQRHRPPTSSTIAGLFHRAPHLYKCRNQTLFVQRSSHTGSSSASRSRAWGGSSTDCTIRGWPAAPLQLTAPHTHACMLMRPCIRYGCRRGYSGERQRGGGGRWKDKYQHTLHITLPAWGHTQRTLQRLKSGKKSAFSRIHVPHRSLFTLMITSFLCGMMEPEREPAQPNISLILWLFIEEAEGWSSSSRRHNGLQKPSWEMGSRINNFSPYENKEWMLDWVKM